MPKLLDDLSGYDFEDLMVDVFRKLGYENPRVHKQGADEGRDIIMEERVDGQTRAVIVECKHRETVSRPVVQKLHSAVTTYEFPGQKRGIVVTSGRFTKPAREYAAKVGRNGAGEEIQLIDGQRLREIADQIGLDLRNGRIEILCDRTLQPYDPTAGLERPLRAGFSGVENLPPAEVRAAERTATFVPMLRVVASVNATFETSVGVIHSVNETNQYVVRADRAGPTLPPERFRKLVSSHLRETTDLDRARFETEFDGVTVDRFGQTETEYNDWMTDQVREIHTTTVKYTGGNNVTYTKECEPKQSDVQIQSVTPVYLPKVTHRVPLGKYEHTLKYAVAGAARETITSPERCVHCGDDIPAKTYTYCANCGSINCSTHTKTERLQGTPICTGCAVTDSFFRSTKYFYDEQNLETFRREYEQMPIYEKAQENLKLAAGIVAGSLLIVISLLGLLISLV